jgi:S-(hydroxymethyl)glutathione dehydrogenase / alcohol dehydrogenase
MKAAILTQLNTPLIVGDLDLPNLACGQVLVEVQASGICGAQLGHIAGVKLKKEFLPCLLGHEGGGDIVDVGDGVTTVKKGDRVVMHWRKGNGIESGFPKYKMKNGKGVGAGLITTFNEYAVVSENRVTKIDNDIPYDIAALLGCSVTTGLGIINNEANLKIGQSVAVFGVGGVGLNIVQGAALVSGYPIIGIDIDDSKLELAKNFGATHVINTTTQNITDELKNILGSPEVDVFIDTTGLPELIETSCNHTKGGGKTIMVGQPKVNDNLTLHSLLQHFKGKVLMDSDGGLTTPQKDINRYLRLYKEGKLKLDGLITKKFALSQINEALDTIRAGKGFTGRCIIELN